MGPSIEQHRQRGRLRLSSARRRGTAIVPALVVVVIVATLSMIFLQLSLAKNKEQRTSVDAKRAFYMAEAGLSEGFMGLCLGKSGNVGSAELPAQFGGGLFWTSAVEHGGGRVTLTTTGLCGAGRATLSISVERQGDMVSSLGFFGDQSITVEDGALIDSYDSRKAPYVAPLGIPVGGLLASGGKVGGNSDITVGGTLLQPTQIFGSVHPGPQGTLFRSRNSVISGSMSPSNALARLPEVRVPPVPSKGDYKVPTGMTTFPSGVVGFDALRVPKSATLYITGPAILVAKSLRTDSGAKLTFDATGGPIRVFIANDLDIGAGSTIVSRSTDPAGVTIQLADTTGNGKAILEATGALNGTIYAPHSSMSVPTGLELCGAVTAKTLTIKAGGKLHFDTALSSSSDEANGPPKLLGWHIVETPNVPAVSLRFDALSEIKKLGLIPKLAKDAHFEIGDDDGGRVGHGHGSD